MRRKASLCSLLEPPMQQLMSTSHFRPVDLPNTPSYGTTYVKCQNSSRMPHNTIATATQKYSYNYVMRQQIPNDNKMFIYIHDGPMTIMKRTGGAVFCDTASGYEIQRDGTSCFDIGASGPIFKENILVCARRPVFSSFLWPFSQKNSLSFPLHGASTLAGSCWLLPTHPHTHAKPTTGQNGNKTNPRKPTRT